MGQQYARMDAILSSLGCFFKLVDNTKRKKDMDYTMNEMAQYIDGVRLHYVVQMCTENASPMLGAMRILEVRWYEKHLVEDSDQQEDEK